MYGTLRRSYRETTWRLDGLEGFLRGIGAAEMGLRISLMYEQVSMDYAESSRSAEKRRQERWRFDAFWYTLKAWVSST
jgi:hypothetical protein